jgi:hypothetical protein
VSIGGDQLDSGRAAGGQVHDIWDVST